jgi:hypothetical protein
MLGEALQASSEIRTVRSCKNEHHERKVDSLFLNILVTFSYRRDLVLEYVVTYITGV